MTGDAANAFWYCVVVRDPLTGRYQHYRCFWTQREAELYKLQLERMGDPPNNRRLKWPLKLFRAVNFRSESFNKIVRPLK